VERKKIPVVQWKELRHGKAVATFRKGLKRLSAQCAAGAALVIVVAVVAVVVSQGDDDRPRLTSGPVSTSTSSDTTTAPASTAPSGGTATDGTAPAAGPLVLQPGRPGQYAYRVIVSGDDRVDRTDATLTVDPAGTDGRQTTTYVTSSRTSRRVLHWSDERVTAERRDECQWQPPFVDVAAPLVPGTEWSNDATCGDERTVERARITGTRRMSAGDTSVDTIEITRTSTITRGDTVQEATTTEYFAPALGVTVRSAVELRTTVRRDGQESTDTRTIVTELRRVPPG
jgi:hypothetical protein